MGIAVLYSNIPRSVHRQTESRRLNRIHTSNRPPLSTGPPLHLYVYLYSTLNIHWQLIPPPPRYYFSLIYFFKVWIYLHAFKMLCLGVTLTRLKYTINFHSGQPPFIYCEPPSPHIPQIGKKLNRINFVTGGGGVNHQLSQIRDVTPLISKVPKTFRIKVLS